MFQRAHVAIITFIVSSFVGCTFADHVGLAATSHDVRTKPSQGMLPFNAIVLAESSKRLPTSRNRRGPREVEQRWTDQPVTASPLSSPTDGASDSPACMPAEFC
jgi:hypothetical protein